MCAFAVVLGIAGAGCAPDRARHTVDDYRADATLRHAQMERCQADPGTLAKTPDCINARQAAVLEDRVRLRDMPPVGLGGQPATSESAAADSERDEGAGDPPARAR